jgi:hypothetical protein
MDTSFNSIQNGLNEFYMNNLPKVHPSLRIGDLADSRHKKRGLKYFNPPLTSVQF